MDFFKFLKKKQVHSFETLLKKAANEPAYRVEFFERLLTEKLVVLTNRSSAQEGFVKLKEETKVGIYELSDGRVPVFTSIEKIHDNNVIKEEVRFLEAAGRDIFNILKGKRLILNPYSAYGKEFTPEEIDRLLKGTFFTNNLEQIIVKKKTEVMIGQPAKYPTEVVKSLNKLFSKNPDVIAAYVGWIHDPSSDDPPHYIFAIETKGGWNDLVKQAGFTAKELLPADEIIDFIQINGRGGIEDYLTKETQPFYKRADLK